MIVDAVLGFVHGLGMWVVSILPSWNPLAELYVQQLPSQGGEFQYGGEVVLRGYLVTANYFLPMSEGVVMLGMYLAILGVWVLLRFVMKLIPGIG